METYGLEQLGIVNAAAVYRNLTPAQLTEHALRRGEGTLSATGALVVKTGKYTGRSANDKFIVDTPAVHDDIAWGKVNRPMEKEKFDAIFAKVTAYLQNKEVYVFDGFAGADPKYTKSFRIVNELASQNLFIHQLLRRPTPEQLADFTADYTIVAAPGFKCVPEIDGTHSEAAILVDYEAHLRHPLRRRDQEVGVLRHELHPAQAGCVPHALLRQHRNGRRLRRVLRPLRHR